MVPAQLATIGKHRLKYKGRDVTLSKAAISEEFTREDSRYVRIVGAHKVHRQLYPESEDDTNRVTERSSRTSNILGPAPARRHTNRKHSHHLPIQISLNIQSSSAIPFQTASIRA